MTHIVSWVFALLVAVAPPGKKIYIEEAMETKTEAEARYTSIANDLIEVVYDTKEDPVFLGPFGRAKTVALMVGIMSHESGLRKDVDFQKGRLAKGDKGKSVCLMQVNVGGGKTAEGWTQTDLLDRKKCFRAALHVIKDSFRRCKHLSKEFLLSAYTAGLDSEGKCFPTHAAKIRFEDSEALYSNSKEPAPKDAEVLKSIGK